MGLLSSLGGLVGMAVGGPMGAAIGGGIGSLGEGGSMSDAFKSGIGNALTAGTMGQAGMIGNVLGGGGNNQAAGIASLFGGSMGGMGGPMSTIASTGGGTGGSFGPMQGGLAQNLMQGIGISDANGQTNPIMGGIMREMLYQQRRPRFENLMSDTELAQYNTGERRPDYKGTAVPGTPRVQTRAMGGMIEGPGTGTSDSIPATIYQNGGPVQEARLSDGEFVMTADAVKGAGSGNRGAGAAKMYEMMNQFERRA
jgi:hypothetical protein|tara:strand:+ start:269 stop:1030 length:762 start_codon:yes stop_codon:yes gene_type:complete